MDERRHEPGGPFDLLVLAVERVLAAVRGAVDEAVAAAHAEIGPADDELEPARDAPVPQVPGLGPRLGHEPGRCPEGTPEDDDRLVVRCYDFQARAAHDASPSFWRSFR